MRFEYVSNIYLCFSILGNVAIKNALEKTLPLTVVHEMNSDACKLLVIKRKNPHLLCLLLSESITNPQNKADMTRPVDVVVRVQVEEHNKSSSKPSRC